MSRQKKDYDDHDNHDDYDDYDDHDDHDDHDSYEDDWRDGKTQQSKSRQCTFFTNLCPRQHQHQYYHHKLHWHHCLHWVGLLLTSKNLV